MAVAEDLKTDDSLGDPVAMVAQWIVHFAMLIYLYTLFGCLIFSSRFFRQMAVIFQFIKLFLIFGGIFPCVLHSQANTIFPGSTGTVHRVAVIMVLMLANIILAFLLPKYISSGSPLLFAKNFLCNTKCPSSNEKTPKKGHKIAEASRKRRKDRCN